MKSNITAVVLTKNEEGNISDCIDSLKFCDEIIVIDDNSTDKTTSIAEINGARVMKRALNDDFAKQRNFALRAAKRDWVLFIDADESVSKDSAKEIAKAIKYNKYDGFYLKRKDYMWEKAIAHGETGNIKLLRLGKKNVGKWTRSVHEKWNITHKTSELNNPIIHHPHKNLAEFIKHVDNYSSLHANENIKEGKTSSISKICLMPFAHFTKNYLLRMGFLDGIEGFIIAFLMSFHSFLSWSKMYVREKATS